MWFAKKKRKEKKKKNMWRDFSSSVKGNRDGAAVRALTSHECGPGLILARCHVG